MIREVKLQNTNVGDEVGLRLQYGLKWGNPYGKFIKVKIIRLSPKKNSGSSFDEHGNEHPLRANGEMKTELFEWNEALEKETTLHDEYSKVAEMFRELNSRDVLRYMSLDDMYLAETFLDGLIAKYCPKKVQ